jgi:hypothetical protein
MFVCVNVYAYIHVMHMYLCIDQAKFFEYFLYNLDFKIICIYHVIIKQN